MGEDQVTLMSARGTEEPLQACPVGLSIASAGAQTAPRATIPPSRSPCGQYVDSGGKRLMAGQMYVEYLTPQNVTRPYRLDASRGIR